MFQIQFFPYGRVDSMLIGVDDKWAFIDGGYRKDGKKAVQHMNEWGIERLDAYIATHRHRNHVGAAPYILARIPTRRVLYAHPDMKSRLLSLCDGANEKATLKKLNYRQLRPGMTFDVGDAHFTCIGPEMIVKCSPGAYMENSNSLILRMNYHGYSALFTGDTPGSVLSKCADKDLKCYMLKNPHHNGALGEKLLSRISPAITVVCNTNPPAKYYQKRLGDAGSVVFTAGVKGDGFITFTSDDFFYE